MKGRQRVILVSGALIFLLTIILFFIVTKEKTAIIWLGFAFILLAEIMLFGGLAFIEFYSYKTSEIIWRVGGGFAFAVASIISIVISLVYMLGNKNYIRSFLALQISLFTIAAVIIIIFFNIAIGVKKSNDKISNSLNQLNSIINRLELLKSDEKNSNYYKLLNKAYEDLRYSDISTYVLEDSELDAKVTELEIALLQEAEDDEVISIIKAILMIINNRKIQVKNSKAGGI